MLKTTDKVGRKTNDTIEVGIIQELDQWIHSVYCSTYFSLLSVNLQRCLGSLSTISITEYQHTHWRLDNNILFQACDQIETGTCLFPEIPA